MAATAMATLLGVVWPAPTMSGTERSQKLCEDVQKRMRELEPDPKRKQLAAKDGWKAELEGMQGREDDGLGHIGFAPLQPVVTDQMKDQRRTRIEALLVKEAEHAVEAGLAATATQA